MPVIIDGTNGISGVDGSASSPAIEGTDSNTGLFYPAADTVALATNGAERVRVDSSGNVGIGTTSPSAYAGILDVKSSDRAAIAYFGGTTYAARVGANSSWATVEGVDAATGSSSYQPLQVGGSILSLATGGSERIRIDSSGNVGIGTASPTTKLKVNAASAANGVVASFENSGSTGAGISLIQAGVDAYDIRMPAGSNALAFYSSGVTERMRITAGGNLLIGATATNTSPARLYLAQGSDYSITLIGGSLTGNQAFRHWIGGTQYYIINDNNTGVYLNYGGTSWVANSDERLKTNLAPITNAAEKVSTLRAVTGRYKNDEEGKSRAFLIAQDVQKVLPEAVHTQSDEQGTLGLSYSDTIPLLVAAIQEQQEQIKQLKARIESLEVQNARNA